MDEIIATVRELAEAIRNSNDYNTFIDADQIKELMQVTYFKGKEPASLRNNQFYENFSRMTDSVFAQSNKELLANYVDFLACMIESSAYKESRRVKTVDVADLFLSQQTDDLPLSFNRMDTVVRYMAIENYFGKNDYGFALYRKMQLARLHEGNEKVEERVDTFKNVIRSFEKSGYDSGSFIALDSNGKLVDGSHRLALCLYFDVHNISAIFLSHRENIQYGLEWFAASGFDDAEIALIVNKYYEILKKLFREKVSTDGILSAEKLLAELQKTFSKEKQTFGRGKFYQSLPVLDFDGQRPTDVRIKEYQLESYLSKNSEVLDIGCNCGFLDISLADKVKHISGVEYNPTLVEIGRKTAWALEVDNVDFCSDDFNHWVVNNHKKFDIVFSFAVHYWLKVTPEGYAKTLAELLNSGGYLIFESQNLDTVDADFDNYVNAFLTQGFSIEREGVIMDDGSIRRRYLVFRKC